MAIRSGTSLASLIESARREMKSGDFEKAKKYYGDAINDPEASTDLQHKLKLEHIGLLLRQIGRNTLKEAITNLYEYLADYEKNVHDNKIYQLYVLMAEAQIGANAYINFQSTITKISEGFIDERDAETILADLFPNYLRLIGLAEAYSANFNSALHYFNKASTIFKERNDLYANRIIQEDVQRLALQRGDKQTIHKLSTINPNLITTPSKALLVSRALRRIGKYQQAKEILSVWKSSSQTDSSLLFHILFEDSLLYHRIGYRHLPAENIRALEIAAKGTLDPDEANTSLLRMKLFDLGLWFVSGGHEFSARLFDVRMLLLQGFLDEAEKNLHSIHPKSIDIPEAAYWYIAAAEISFIRGLNACDAKASMPIGHAKKAIEHLQKSLEIAEKLQLSEIRGYVYRMIGNIQAYLYKNPSLARKYWAKANIHENNIASLQISDETRVVYQESVPTYHDQIINITADQIILNSAKTGVVNGKQIASVVAAIEAARSQTFLELISSPDLQAEEYHVPQADNDEACWKWYVNLAQNIPEDMVLWLLHATPQRIFHGIVCRKSLTWSDYSIN